MRGDRASPPPRAGADTGRAASCRAGGAVNALQHLVARIAAPVSPATLVSLKALSLPVEGTCGPRHRSTFPFTKTPRRFTARCDAPATAIADAYRKFKAWCDEYFYLPHRQEPRGVADLLRRSRESRSAGRLCVRALGGRSAAFRSFRLIVARRKDTPFDEAARERLL